MAKLLLVDDDIELLDMCKLWFEKKHVVDTATSIADAKAHLNLGGFDLIVLDLNLPDGTGKEVVDQLRTTGSSIPIIILTGQNDINNKVELLEIGADDYLTKPFHLKELEARLKALLRRPGELSQPVIEAGSLVLNLQNASVTLDNKALKLTPKEFALLEFFMRNPGQTFTQDALIARVWANDSETSPDVVRIYIQKLRKKLQSDSKQSHEYIKNLRGHGYIFEPE